VLVPENMTSRPDAVGDHQAAGVGIGDVIGIDAGKRADVASGINRICDCRARRTLQSELLP